MFKVASWNVNSIKARLPHLTQWLTENQPDVLAVQETKTVDENFPLADIQALGYQAVISGQKSYNGVAIFSKEAMDNIVTDIPGFDSPQRRIIAATVRGVRILNLYVPNGQTVDSDKYIFKLDWLKHVTEFVATELKSSTQFLTLGDFNIAPEDRDVHDPAVWAGQVLCSDKERQALQALMNTGLFDSFRLFSQPERLFSWWDYRNLGFRRNHGLRIDHILVNAALRDKCVSCHIDKTPRKWERPSDHAPVIAEFDL